MSRNPIRLLCLFFACVAALAMSGCAVLAAAWLLGDVPRHIVGVEPPKGREAPTAVSDSIAQTRTAASRRTVDVDTARLVTSEAKSGRELETAGQLERALDRYDRAIAIDATQVESWFRKGVVLERLGRAREALPCYYRVNSIAPQHAEAWYRRGMLLLDLGNRRLGVECLERFIRLAPNHAEAAAAREIVRGR